MADKFPNLPGTNVSILDGNLQVEAPPRGPTVAVLGSATKGPAFELGSAFSGAGAVAKYGTSGSLGRGLAEAFQGGADNAVGYRLFATKGKLEHIGDVSGAAGITVESGVAGADSLEYYSILYDQVANQLRVYEVSSGVKVFDKTGAVEAVNLGGVTVTGTAVNDEGASNQIFGSIGKHLPVRDTVTAQTGQLDAAHTVLTCAGLGSDLNLGKLGFVDATSTPIMCQLRSADGTKLAEEKVSAVNVGAGTVTLAAAIDAAHYDEALSTGLHDNAQHSLRFVSLSVGERMDKVIDNRLSLTGPVAPGSELLELPGSNFNGLPLLENSSGSRVSSTKSEVEPHKMNLYEGLKDAALALEASDIDLLVLMDAYLDDPALDGQTSNSDTILPTTEAAGLLLVSGVDANAGVDNITANSVAGFADRVSLAFATAGDKTSALSKLGAAGEGACWAVFSEAKGAAFGDNRESDEIVRGARILNWESTSTPEVFTVDTIADVGGALGATYFTFNDGTNTYYVWMDVDNGSVDPAPGGGAVGIEADISAGDAAEVVAAAVKAAIDGSAANVTTSIAGEVVTVTLDSSEAVADAADVDSGFTIAVLEQGESLNVLVHFDRDVGFALDGVDGNVVGAQNPAFKIYSTDLLLFHREKEILGELVHFWYTSKADTEGNVFHEVNFAYALGQICHDLTENETAVIGVIGVRPPANHYQPASLATWIGKSPEYDEDGDVSKNGTGLLGNKFLAGRGLNGLFTDANQFDAGFKATESGHLDDSEILLDANDFEVDLGKYLSIVATWPVMSNFSDTTGLGYIASGAALYAGLLGGLAPWSASTAKSIGGRNIRLPRGIAKRHQNSLIGANLIVFNGDSGDVNVVDGPSAALSTSDFTRNMTIRFVSEVIRRVREVGREFLGDPLSPIRKAALETQLQKELSELQRLSDGALQSYNLGITQTPLDKVRGTAKVSLSLSIINELRKIFVDVSLTV